MLSFAELNDLLITESFVEEEDIDVSLVKNNERFWKTFADITNANAEAVSKTLGVDRQIVLTWNKKIQSILNKLDRIRSEKSQSKMLNTGR